MENWVKTTFVALALVAVIAIFFTARENEWDRSRTRFHNETAPKLVGHFNEWMGITGGRIFRTDSSSNFERNGGEYYSERYLYKKGQIVGQVKVYAHSDFPNAVSCKYELSRDRVSESPFIQWILRQTPEVITPIGDFTYHNAGTTAGGKLTVFIGLTPEAIERTRQAQHQPELPARFF